MAIKIYTSANNGEEILILPVVPKDLPAVIDEWQHEEFVTTDKVLTIIGKRKRKTMSLELLLPVNKDYKFICAGARQNGKDYIDFWYKWSGKEVPMRLVVTDGDAEILNIAYTIQSLNWSEDRKKDIVAVLEIAEYIFTNEQPAAAEKKYEWENINLRYGGSGYAVKASNINGRFIVPVRKVLELLGYTVVWWADTKQITYYRPDSPSQSRTLTTQFEIYDGTAFAYIYLLGYELGVYTVWNAETRTVVMTDIT